MSAKAVDREENMFSAAERGFIEACYCFVVAEFSFLFVPSITDGTGYIHAQAVLSKQSQVRVKVR